MKNSLLNNMYNFEEDYSFELPVVEDDELPISQESIDNIITLIEGVGSAFSELIDDLLS
ncbi:MAG: hypothetical protein JXR48_12345 [Candidatus Delongbacteria bacterium]|nr:hypothetical protein [Candidatus Delongbacteria bacterium]MBN2835742.1 hypothetical protein [Candidatus Delongbacteria bacterium]